MKKIRVNVTSVMTIEIPDESKLQEVMEKATCTFKDGSGMAKIDGYKILVYDIVALI